MVATSQPLATEIGVATLRRGGSAVDAAIAANAALGLTEPTSCGIGGDLFAIVWDAASGRLHGLNASGRSPLSLTLERLLERGSTLIPERGPLAVSVPGAVDGWCELHARFGRLPLATCSRRRSRYAREGFPVTEVIGAAWAAGARALAGYPGFAEVFMPGGRAPARRRAVREPGAGARLRAHRARRPRGVLRRRDRRRDRAVRARQRRLSRPRGSCARTAREWVEPVSTTYRGWRVFELPPNGQGIAVLQMLNILEGFDLRLARVGQRRAPAPLHRSEEARVRGPRAVLRRSRIRGRARRAARLEGLRGRAPRAASIRSARRRRRRTATQRPAPATPSISRRPTPTATWCR